MLNDTNGLYAFDPRISPANNTVDSLFLIIFMLLEYNGVRVISESRIHNTVIIILLFIKIIQLLLSFLHILLIKTQKTA